MDSLIKHTIHGAGMSSYFVYGVECSLCGLIYVGETKGQLRNRMSGHRYEINHGSNQLLYFTLPDHSILSFKVRILEKCTTLLTILV